MSERQKEIIRTIDKALPYMSDFDKGYLLGVAESSANKKKNDPEKETKQTA